MKKSAMIFLGVVAVIGLWLMGSYNQLVRVNQDSSFSDSIHPINKDPDLLSNFSSVVFMAMITVFGIVLLTYLVSWLGRNKAWWPGGLVGLGLGVLLNFTAGIFFGLVGLILDYILSRNYKEWKKKKKPVDWENTWGGFRSSAGSSSSSSGSSFSFGGGSSGGGSSGGW